jgi:zinc transporter ZupT
VSPILKDGDSEKGLSKKTKERCKMIATKKKDHDHAHSHGHSHEFNSENANSVVLAMVIHGFFEGLGLGTFDDKSEFFGFMIAILVHKWGDALAVGTSFAKSKLSRGKIVCLVIVYVLATPSGAIVGMLFESSGDIVSSIL